MLHMYYYILYAQDSYQYDCLEDVNNSEHTHNKSANVPKSDLARTQASIWK